MTHTSRYVGYHASTNRDYLTDGDESHRAPSDRTVSEYIVSVDHATMVKGMKKDRPEKYEKDEGRRSRSTHNSRVSVLSGSSRQGLHPLRKSASHGSICDNGSDIYVTSAAYRATSDISHVSHHSLSPSLRMGHRAPSHCSYGSAKSVKSHTSRKDGIIIETMSTPNPFCPNTKGVCCLMLLLNLGLILVTLGFVIVIQFFQPLIVWILGIIFLIFGFLTLIGSLIYCVHVFRNAKHPHDINPEDLYWTKYWQGHVGSAPEVYYKAEDKYQDDGYSDRLSKYSNRYYDRQRY
ncbi:uncharacterized protein LOC116426079 [Nomia melanderi]|uniref:uncharacterized protein LOC116426079 n=1 Tax=Nomia melanderi TaxID=2448451 RepID=UPI001304736F|nr:uncharacterized protein LOC116426079 [Nomia melanderi]XP_031830404.1 uncharacterized protein LOC116426079 [Nomia melanderi]XP_031830405.1 uncharacterized protein LOC116426079 [Nomia melanderi]